jgi:hypothetical protein
MGSASNVGPPYLAIHKRGESTSGLTNIYTVTSIHDGSLLATIRWYGPWRQYVLHPDSVLAIWSDGCLREAADAITQMNTQHRARAARRRADNRERSD